MTTFVPGSLTNSLLRCTYVNVAIIGDTQRSYQVMKVGDTSGVASIGEFKGVAAPGYSGVINNLMPGTPYAFQLQTRNGSASTWVNDGPVLSVTTLTSTLNVQSQGSSTVTAAWSIPYADAKFQLTYNTPTGSASIVDLSTAAISAGTMSVVIGNLASATTYTFNLSIREGALGTFMSLGQVDTITSASGMSNTTMIAPSSMMYPIISPAKKDTSPLPLILTLMLIAGAYVVYKKMSKPVLV